MSHRRRTRRQVVAGSGALLSAALAGCSIRDDGPTSAAGQSVEREESATPTTPTQTAPRPAPRDATFETDAGTVLVGTAYGAGPCGVVLVAQPETSRLNWAPQATALADADCLAFAVDVGDDGAAGVEAAVNYLRRGRDVAHVVLVGASRGGAAVLDAATRLGDRVDGVVSLSADGGANRAGALRGRKLFVASENDGRRVVETARRLGVNARAPKELVVYGGSAHGRELFASVHRRDLFGRVRALLTAACPESDAAAGPEAK